MTHLVPVLRPVLGSPFRRAGLYRAAGEIPSWHIAPVRTGTVTDLISGSQIITFTNSSPAWGFNSAGVLVQPTANVPFVEYDPATGACLGWRIWGAVTNLRTSSESVLALNSYSLINATLTTQSVSTPINGVTSASLFALNSGANTGNNTDGMTFGSSISLVNSTAYTQSAFFKLSGTNTIRLRSNVTGEVFDIVPASGATTPIGTITACTVQAAPNGWHRVSWSFTSTTSVPGNRGDHWTIKTPVADGTTGFWITGAQINTGPLAPYVPTKALSASSTADVASITGSAFTGIWNQPAGTLHASVIMAEPTKSGNQFIIRASDNGYNNSVALNVNSGNPSIATSAGGVFDGAATSAQSLTTAAANFAGAYAANDLALAHANATVTDSTATMPSNPTRIDFGADHNGLNRATGVYIREAAIFRSRRPNSNITAMIQ